MEEVGEGGGQVIVLAAFIIMGGLLVVGSILNGAILSNNVGSRGLDVDGDSLTEIDVEASNQSSHAVYSSFVSNPPRSVGDAEDLYRNYIQNYTAASRVLMSEKETFVSSDVTSVTPGIQMAQNHTDVELNESGGDEDWTAVENFEEVTMLAFNISETSDIDSNLTIEVQDSGGSPIWRMNLSEESIVPILGTDKVYVEDFLNGNSNSYTDGSLGEDVDTEIEVLNDSVSGFSGDEDMLLDDALSSAGDDLKLRIEGGDNFEGLYDFRVYSDAGSDLSVTQGNCGSASCITADNRTTGVVLDAEYQLTYESTQIENSLTTSTNTTTAAKDVLNSDESFFISSIASVGGGSGGCTPTVDAGISDTSSSNPNGNNWDVQVDWTASACDNDLDSGTLTVTETGSGDEESTSLNPSGGSADETDTVTFNGLNNPNTFESEVVINDDDGNQATATDSDTP